MRAVIRASVGSALKMRAWSRMIQAGGGRAITWFALSTDRKRPGGLPIGRALQRTAKSR